MQDDKKRVTVTLGAELLDRFDALCRERGQDRAHAIAAMISCALKRQARSKRKDRGICWDPDLMILEAKGLLEVARMLEGDKHDHLDDPHEFSGTFHVEPVLLALAAEIALKAWQCRDREGGAPDHCHDLAKLFDGLSDDAKERLEAFQTHPDTFGAHMVEDPGDPFAMVGMRHVLEAHCDTFEAWRYSYEVLAKRGGLFVATSQLVAAVEAIIETYNPPPVVRLGSLGNMVR